MLKIELFDKIQFSYNLFCENIIKKYLEIYF